MTYVFRIETEIGHLSDSASPYTRFDVLANSVEQAIKKARRKLTQRGEKIRGVVLVSVLS